MSNKTTDQILLTMLKYIEDNNLDIDPKLIKRLHNIVIKNAPNSRSILKREQSMRDMKKDVEQAIDQYIKNKGEHHE